MHLSLAPVRLAGGAQCKLAHQAGCSAGDIAHASRHLDFIHLHIHPQTHKQCPPTTQWKQCSHHAPHAHCPSTMVLECQRRRVRRSSSSRLLSLLKREVHNQHSVCVCVSTNNRIPSHVDLPPATLAAQMITWLGLAWPARVSSTRIRREPVASCMCVQCNGQRERTSLTHDTPQSTSLRLCAHRSPEDLQHCLSQGKPQALPLVFHPPNGLPQTRREEKGKKRHGTIRGHFLPLLAGRRRVCHCQSVGGCLGALVIVSGTCA
jgi:hypothetical protein